MLKAKLAFAPIITAPNWNYGFRLMCDASNYAVGVVLGQKKYKIFHPIHYTNENQVNYATTENELLAIIYAPENSDLISLALKWLCILIMQPLSTS